MQDYHAINFNKFRRDWAKGKIFRKLKSSFSDILGSIVCKMIRSILDSTFSCQLLHKGQTPFTPSKHLERCQNPIPDVVKNYLKKDLRSTNVLYNRSTTPISYWALKKNNTHQSEVRLIGRRILTLHILKKTQRRSIYSLTAT